MASPNWASPKATPVLTETDCELDVSVDEELPSFLEQDSIRPSVNAKKTTMYRRVSFFIILNVVGIL